MIGGRGPHAVGRRPAGGRAGRGVAVGDGGLPPRRARPSPPTLEPTLAAAALGMPAEGWEPDAFIAQLRDDPWFDPASPPPGRGRGAPPTGGGGFVPGLRRPVPASAHHRASTAIGWWPPTARTGSGLRRRLRLGGAAHDRRPGDAGLAAGRRRTGRRSPASPRSPTWAPLPQRVRGHLGAHPRGAVHPARGTSHDDAGPDPTPTTRAAGPARDVEELRDRWAARWPEALALWSPFTRLRAAALVPDRRGRAAGGPHRQLRHDPPRRPDGGDRVAPDHAGARAVPARDPRARDRPPHPLPRRPRRQRPDARPHPPCAADRRAARAAGRQHLRRHPHQRPAPAPPRAGHGRRLRRAAGRRRRRRTTTGSGPSTSACTRCSGACRPDRWRGAQRDERLEGDAVLGARLVRSFAGRWLDGAGRFAALCLPYLLQEAEPDGGPIWQTWLDADGAGAGGFPDGLTELDPDEGTPAVHPALDPELNGDLPGGRRRRVRHRRASRTAQANAPSPASTASRSSTARSWRASGLAPHRPRGGGPLLPRAGAPTAHPVPQPREPGRHRSAARGRRAVDGLGSAGRHRLGRDHDAQPGRDPRHHHRAARVGHQHGRGARAGAGGPRPLRRLVGLDAQPPGHGQLPHAGRARSWRCRRCGPARGCRPRCGAAPASSR